jgi:hypothetical protein
VRGSVGTERFFHRPLTPTAGTSASSQLRTRTVFGRFSGFGSLNNGHFT